MIRKKISPYTNGIPDGEGFNALPIAFVYEPRAERSDYKEQSQSGLVNRASTALRSAQREN